LLIRIIRILNSPSQIIKQCLNTNVANTKLNVARDGLLVVMVELERWRLTGEGVHLGQMTQQAMTVEKQEEKLPPQLCAAVWPSRCPK
jgi:hypothetical protein